MNFSEPKPIYLQIADLVLANITSHKWDEGQKIPSVREMAGAMEVNPNTVMRAYSFLQEKEIIRNKRGIGYFVSDAASGLGREIMKKEFMENALPELFRAMKLLGIKFSDLKDLSKELDLN